MQWYFERVAPATTKRKIDCIVERLRGVYTAEGADIWLHAHNRGLGNERPIDWLAAGRFERILAAVERLSAGAT